jgi:hypothetical protein
VTRLLFKQYAPLLFFLFSFIIFLFIYLFFVKLHEKQYSLFYSTPFFYITPPSLYFLLQARANLQEFREHVAQAKLDRQCAVRPHLLNCPLHVPAPAPAPSCVQVESVPAPASAPTSEQVAPAPALALARVPLMRAHPRIRHFPAPAPVPVSAPTPASVPAPSPASEQAESAPAPVPARFARTHHRILRFVPVAATPASPAPAPAPASPALALASPVPAPAPTSMPAHYPLMWHGPRLARRHHGAAIFRKQT